MIKKLYKMTENGFKSYVEGTSILDAINNWRNDREEKWVGYGCADEEPDKIKVILDYSIVRAKQKKKKAKPAPKSKK